MDESILIERREQARRMCAEKNVSILPYGNAHWVKGFGVDLIIADLAWLRAGDLDPYEAIER